VKQRVSELKRTLAAVQRPRLFGRLRLGEVLDQGSSAGGSRQASRVQRGQQFHVLRFDCILIKMPFPRAYYLRVSYMCHDASIKSSL